VTQVVLVAFSFTGEELVAFVIIDDWVGQLKLGFKVYFVY
jgi:hypothetical protein